MNTTETPFLVPLGKEAHQAASQLAIEQSTPQKGKRVYLNTLAVFTVHTYLKWLQIETDFSLSETWKSSLAAAFYATDLVIPGIGKLECHPILPGETNLTLNPTINTDLIGYVAVKFDENLDKGQLLGFIPALEASEFPEQISISNLKPLDNLLDCIPDSFDDVNTLNFKIPPINLSNWLDNIFEIGWLAVEYLPYLSADNLAFGTRSNHPFNSQGNSESESTSRGKIIDLGVKIGIHKLALIVTLTSVNKDEEIEICLRVYPTANQTYLPPNLQLIVLDETGITSIEMSARNEDNWMKLEFTGQPGEHFTVKLALREISITEEFVI